MMLNLYVLSSFWSHLLIYKSFKCSDNDNEIWLYIHLWMITNSFINQSRKDGFTRFVICFNVQAGADQLLQEWRVYKRRQGTHHQVILCILIIFLLLHQHMLQSHSMISIGIILITIDSNSTIASHAAITFVVIILTIATTVGYQVIDDDDDDDHGNISNLRKDHHPHLDEHY